MDFNYEQPFYVSICNIGQEIDSFIPYKGNLKYKLNPGDQINFNTTTSEAGIYYKNQQSKNIGVVLTDPFRVKTSIQFGSYNSTSGEFTNNASFSALQTNVIENDQGGFDYTYEVAGTLPYLPADGNIGMPAGNRFTIKLSQGIEDKSNLPSGNIATISLSDGTTQTYNKNAFEDDGALIVTVNARKISILTISIKWESDAVSTYTFTFKNVSFAEDDQKVQDIKVINLPFLYTNYINIIGYPELEGDFTIELLNTTIDETVKYVPYQENFPWSIGANESVKITVNTPEEAMYYLMQANDKLSVIVSII